MIDAACQLCITVDCVPVVPKSARPQHSGLNCVSVWPATRGKDAA